MLKEELKIKIKNKGGISKKMRNKKLKKKLEELIDILTVHFFTESTNYDSPVNKDYHKNQKHTNKLLLELKKNSSCCRAF